MGKAYEFHHQDGRVFEFDGDAPGIDPVVGDWVAFDEDIVLVTGCRGETAGVVVYDVVDHPRRREMLAAMLDTSLAVDDRWVNADRIARAA